MIQYRVVNVWHCPVSEVEFRRKIQYACSYLWGDVKFLRDVENAINECSEVS